MKALRFLTAGSVDDGKSTLIGRLLFDGQAILADQLDTLETFGEALGMAFQLSDDIMDLTATEAELGKHGFDLFDS